MKLSRSIKVALVATTAAVVAASPAFAGVTITGAGSTFAAPLISACKTAWQNASSNTVSYSGGGSGTGRKNADTGVGDFNFSDATYTPAKSTIIHIPVVAAPVAIAYNLNSSKTLYLSPKTVSDIFAGKVTMWNDPEIAADNNGSANVTVFKKDASGNVVKDKSGAPVVLKSLKVNRYYTLPNHKITVIYRGDSSGTTQNLTNMFHAVTGDVWTKAGAGAFTSVFPGNINDIANLGRFQAATGSAGVSALAAKTKYSITYVEASYASAQHLGLAGIKNANGDFQGPDAGGTAAFLNAATASADGKLTFDYNTKNPGAYVLGIVSYALVDTAATGSNAAAVKSLLQAILNPSCPTTDATLQYSTITGSLLATDTALIAKLKG
jgi:phosphate transport system substrate-binding protein